MKGLPIGVTAACILLASGTGVQAQAVFNPETAVSVIVEQSNPVLTHRGREARKYTADNVFFLEVQPDQYGQAKNEAVLLKSDSNPVSKVIVIEPVYDYVRALTTSGASITACGASAVQLARAPIGLDMVLPGIATGLTFIAFFATINSNHHFDNAYIIDASNNVRPINPSLPSMALTKVKNAIDAIKLNPALVR